MAVSGSVNFALTGNDLVIAARRKIGIHADEEPLEAVDLVSGLQGLTMMLKAWQADGVMCWTFTELTLTLIQGTASYVFGSGGSVTTVPLDIETIEINRGTSDLRMIPLSREDYRALPNKTTQGYPTQFYYQRARAGGTLYVWPAPDATAGTLKINARRLIMDMDASVDDVDLPQEWFEAIIYGLADRIAEDYGLSATPDGMKVASQAARSYGVVKGLDTGEGEGSLSIVPAGFERW